MARGYVIPDSSKTVHFVGDVHAGAISQQRLDKVTRDLNSLNVPAVAARIQVGDSCDNGTGTQDALAAAFYAGLTTPVARTVPGNHDTYGLRTIAQWAASLGVTVTPWTYDLGFVRLIGVGDMDATNSNSALNNIFLPQAHLDYLDAALSSAGQTPCWVVCHAPLANTVLGSSSADNQQNSSSGGGFFAAHAPTASSDDTAIRTILGNHSNAKAWICGHTHSDVNTPGFITTLSLGGHNVAHINCSSIYYTGAGTIDMTDRMCSVYVTQKTDGTGLEVRVRDHGAGAWIGVGVGSSQRVTTVTY
jgi:hypothetical protein